MVWGGREDEAWDGEMLAAAVACEQAEKMQKGPRASHPCSRI